MSSIIAVEAILRLALDPRVDTKVLRLVHGLAPEVADLMAKHALYSDEAYVALGRVLELTGIGSKSTIEAVVERQNEQVGAIVQTRKGVSGGFVIVDREERRGRGTAARWTLPDREYEGLPLRYADGTDVTGQARRWIEETLRPNSEAGRTSDTAYRVMLLAVATQGFGDVPLVAGDLVEWGWSRSAAYRAIAEVRRLGWHRDGVLYLTELLEDPYYRAAPLQRHLLRVREWIERLVDTQVAWAAQAADELQDYLAKFRDPGRMAQRVREACLRRIQAPLRT